LLEFPGILESSFYLSKKQNELYADGGQLSLISAAGTAVTRETSSVGIKIQRDELG